MPTTFNDEMLMAYVDAELDASTARLVEQAVKDNPDLAARVEAFRGSAAIAKQAFAAKLEEPVPDALLKSVNAAIEKERQRARDATPARSVATSPSSQPFASAARACAHCGTSTAKVRCRS